MSLLSENVIPGNHGKVFETDAKEHHDLLIIQKLILDIEGIKDVIIDENVFPKKITIHTNTIVSVHEIEEAVKRTGYHAIPKTLFSL